MRCPFCSHEDTSVKDSRPTEDNISIRRRRQCEACGARFTTFERLQLKEVTVLKKNGERRPFDREKLQKSINIAVRKRNVTSDQVEKIVSDIVYKTESSNDSEIQSSQIGEMVMDALAALDQVAYVRFASVYRDFCEAKDFEKFIDQLKSNGK